MRINRETEFFFYSVLSWFSVCENGHWEKKIISGALSISHFRHFTYVPKCVRLKRHKKWILNEATDKKTVKEKQNKKRREKTRPKVWEVKEQSFPY